MKNIILLPLLITVLLPLMALGADARDSIETLVEWKLSLDADGKITELAPLDPEFLPALRMQIEPVVRTWHFTPGKVNGKPAPTETTLLVGVMLDPTNASRYHGHITSAATGPVYRHVVTPKYPQAAERSRREGGVMLRVDYDAEGRVTSIKDVPKMGTTGIDRTLTDAAIEAVRQWTFRPEIVAGKGIAGGVLAPVCFQLRDTSCQWKRKRGDTPVQSNAPIALASVVGLDMTSAKQTP